MFVNMPKGRNYSHAEVSEMLTDIGFMNMEKRPLPGPAEVIIGHKQKKQSTVKSAVFAGTELTGAI